MDVDFGPAVDAAREVRIVVRDDVEHLWIEFNRVDLAGAVIECKQHLFAAAGPEHQYLWFLEQVVRKGCRRVIEVFERPQIAGELRESAKGVRVDENPELRRRFGDIVERETGRVAKRDRRALHHAHEPEWARALLEDPSFGNEQRRCQALVLRNMRMKGDEPGRQP